MHCVSVGRHFVYKRRIVHVQSCILIAAQLLRNKIQFIQFVLNKFVDQFVVPIPFSKLFFSAKKFGDFRTTKLKMEAKENGVAVTDLADLQRQLNEATEKVARLEKMIKNVKAEKEDLAKENYDLHRTASSYRKRLGEMGIWAKSVSACSTHLQKVVSEIFVQSVEDVNPKQQKAAPVVKVASVSATISVDVSEKKAKPKAASQASAPVVNRVEALPPVSKVTSTPKTAPSAQSPPIAVPAPPKPIVQVLAAPKLVPAPKVVPAQAQQPKSAAPSVKASAAPPLVKTLAQAPSAHSTPIAGQRVQAVSKPTLHVAATPKTVPAPSNPPKRPPLKHIEITPSQTLHIKQMAEAGRKAIDAGKFFHFC